MLIVRDIEKSYGDLRAVEGVSFELRTGEAFGLLGPNGAGKSTTIGVIVGAIAPDGGTVEFDGASGADIRRNIGLAPQSLSLYEPFSAEENLRFFGRLYGLSGSRLKDRVEWSLELSGLKDRRRGRVSTFSGGMKRRLNIAVAMVHDPALVILDEPTVGVDPQSRNHIFEAIEKLKGEGRTVLYTTHYMEEAQRLCDRVAIMDRGKILAMDTVEGLIDAHGGASRIRLTSQDGAPVEGFEREADGAYVKLTGAPMDELSRVVESGASIGTLTVRRPDLESVFLSLTGRTLRDE